MSRFTSTMSSTADRISAVDVKSFARTGAALTAVAVFHAPIIGASIVGSLMYGTLSGKSAA